MREENTAFLPYFFTEPIFSIKSEGALTTKDANEKEADKKAMHYPEVKPEKTDNQEHLIEEASQVLTNSKPIENKPTFSPLPYSGKNLKKVLILFENKINQRLEDGEKTFLGKVLQAVQLNFDDVALLNVSLVEESAFDQINNFNAFIQISLGVKDNRLTFNADLPYYNIINKNKASYLLADSLKQIKSDKEKKVLLWNNLQKLFTKP